MTLSLTFERCVRSRSTSASCQVCVDVCPARAVSLEGPKRSVAVALDDCTSCGLCEAACPTQAFSGTAPKLERQRFTCGADDLPCVGALSTEALVAQALQGPVELLAKTCASGWTGHARARSAVEQANVLLASFGVPHRVSFLDESTCVPPPAKKVEPTIPPRRQFIGLFVPSAVPSQKPVLRAPERLEARLLREPAIPARRGRLLAALPSALTPRAGSVPSESIGFSSSKRLDEATCTGCLSCVTSCPTGALTSSRLKDQVRFDSSRCVKCHLCHDVCEPKALTLAPQFDVTAFLDFSPRTLVKLQVAQCGECGSTFKRDGDPLCGRCRDHDEEARELWGHNS